MNYRSKVTEGVGYIIVAVVALLILLVMFGCSSQRKVSKTTEKQRDTMTASTQVKTETSDKTVTVRTESFDTTATLPGIKVQSESSGVNTQTVVGDDTLTAQYDPVKNVIKAAFTAPKRTVKVQGKRTEEIKADVQQVVEVKEDTTATHESLIETKDKQSKSSWVVFGIAGMLILVGVIYLALRYFRKYLPF